ncbi:MAG: hypothetical protein JXR83_19380 [Deltaproteobacteria bacterium]|nr:hypothetical protein [Deltaproteobacteria bacterium]
MTLFRCPECGAEFDKQVFICPRCYTILDDTLLEQEAEAEDSDQATDVVEMADVLGDRLANAGDSVGEVESASHRIAVKAVTDARIAIPQPKSPFAPELGLGEQVTSPALTALTAEPDDARLALVPGIDLRDFDLTVFEAYVATRVDGTSTIAEIRSAVAITTADMNAVVAVLKGKGVVQVIARQPEKKRAPRRVAKPVVAPAPPRPSPSSPPPPPPSPPPPPAPKALEKPAPATVAPPAAPRIRSPAAEAPPSAAANRPTPVQTESERLAAAAKAGRQKKDRSLLQAIGFSKKVDFLDRAVDLANAGDIDGAIEYLESTIPKARDPAPLLNHLALLMVKTKKDFEYAEQLLEKAEQLDPTNPTYRKNLQKVLILKTRRV